MDLYSGDVFGIVEHNDMYGLPHTTSVCMLEGAHVSARSAVTQLVKDAHQRKPGASGEHVEVGKLEVVLLVRDKLVPPNKVGHLFSYYHVLSLLALALYGQYRDCTCVTKHHSAAFTDGMLILTRYGRDPTEAAERALGHRIVAIGVVEGLVLREQVQASKHCGSGECACMCHAHDMQSSDDPEKRANFAKVGGAVNCLQFCCCSCEPDLAKATLEDTARCPWYPVAS